MSWIKESGWVMYDDEDDKKTEPLPNIPRTLQGVFEIDQSEWATNSLFTVYKKEWTSTIFTYEVYVHGDRRHIANDIDDDLQAYLKSEYERHCAIDFSEYFDKGHWYNVSEPIWTKAEAL